MKLIFCRHPFFFQCLIAICMLLAGNRAYGTETVTITMTDQRLQLGDRCEILEDKTGQLTLDRILTDEYSKQFRPSTGIIPNYGFTDSSYWVRLILKNASGKELSRLLEVAFPQIDITEFYLIDSSEGLIAYESSGRNYPFNKRKISHRNCVFQFDVPAGKTVHCYLRISTEDGMIFPLNIWSTSEFIKKIQLENMFFGIYYGIILVMIFYNLFIFFSTGDRNYLLYVAFIAFFGLFQLSMNGLSIQYLYPDNSWLGRHLTPFFIGMSCFFSGLFSIRFLNMDIHTPVMYRIMQVLALSGLVLAILSFPADYALTIIAGQILPAIMIIVAITAALVTLRKGDRSARFYLIAWSVFCAGVMLSVLRVLGFIPHNLVTEYGLQIGSEIQMVLLSLALADRINIIETENERIQEHALRLEQEKVENLNRSKREIENANALLSLSEEKYRLIVEGSSDIIFTLDRDLNFITANKAIATAFKLDPAKISGMNFMELLYTHEAEQSMFGILAREKLEEFRTTREPVYFRAQFISAINTEPIEMQVHLEYLNISGKNEILGKMSNIADDSLLNYFISENQVYLIGNYLITAEEITHRITRNLKKFISASQIKMIQIALREIIINSIEHGNLEISFDEKSQAISNGSYFELIRHRQNDPAVKNKRVRIEYSVTDDNITYTISDDGPGFQYTEYLRMSPEAANAGYIAHGRGLFITRNIFDEVKFNERGNAVTLIKYLNNEE